MPIDTSGHLNLNILRLRVDNYFQDGNFFRLVFEEKITNLWNYIESKYKQNINCYRIKSNEELSENSNHIIEYDHNIFLTDLCEIYNTLVNKYNIVYVDNLNQKNFNCKVSFIHIDNNPVLSYFKSKIQETKQDKEEDKNNNYKFLRGRRKRTKK